MTAATAGNHRRPLAVALLAALHAPGLAAAQAAGPDRQQQLEARVAELEQQRETVWAYLWRQAHAARRWWLRGATGAASSCRVIRHLTAEVC